MRALLLLAFVGVMSLTAAGQLLRFKREIVDQSGSLIRQKRAGLFDEMFDSSCESKCDEALASKVNATGFNDMDNPFSFLSTDAKTIEAVCKQYQASKSCYSNCPKKESTPTFDTFKLLCEEKKEELLKHLPCYQAADATAEKECEVKCGSIDSITNATDATLNSTNFEDLASLDKIFDIMGPLCTYLECAISCAANVFPKQCPKDKDAGTFFKDMATFGSTAMLRELEDLDAMLGLDLMPKECRVFSKPSNATVTKDGDNDFEIDDDFISSLFKTDSSSGSDMLAMAQKLIDQQSTIYEKTSRNLDVELEKMKLEMKLLEKQLGK